MEPIKSADFIPLKKETKPVALNDKTHARKLQIEKQSRELEKLFVTHIIKAMEKTIPDGFLSSSGSSLPSMLFSSVMADAIVEQQGLGLSEMISRSLNEKDDLTALDKMPLLDAVDLIKTKTLDR